MFSLFSEKMTFRSFSFSFTSLTSTGRHTWCNIEVMFECTRFDIHVHILVTNLNLGMSQVLLGISFSQFCLANEYSEHKKTNANFLSYGTLAKVRMSFTT